MAYDEKFAARIRTAIAGYSGLTEKKMFGGVGFLLNGNMAVGTSQGELHVRVGPERYEEALELPGAGLFDLTGKPMRGWVSVDPTHINNDDTLAEWVGMGARFAMSLPAK